MVRHPPTFGTDGMRGRAGTELTPELVLSLGRAFARVQRPECCAVGRDTRLSGTMLQAAFQAGMCSEGVEVVDLGVMPTPGVAWLSGEMGCAAAVVSASHNPFFDNGIKLFGVGGVKLPDELEREVEAELGRLTKRSGDQRGRGVGQDGVDAGAGPRSGDRSWPRDQPGVVTVDLEAAGRYAEHLAGILEPGCLSGLKIVLDTANGATVRLAPSVLRQLGAEIVVIAASPDGRNINDRCGSTHPEAMVEAVLAHGADVGLAFDGDGDRLIASDANGRLVNGDEMLAILAGDLSARGLLARSCVAVTVMTNLGFHQAMAGRGIKVLQTDVGDRYVLEAMEKEGLVLGGEQSGHIVQRHLAGTGDGILTGLSLLGVMLRSGRSLGDLAGDSMQRFPQEMVNVPVRDPSSIDGAGPVWATVEELHAELDGQGRVLLRASGTEKVVRVMVEASSARLAKEMADRLARVVAAELEEA